MSDVKKAAYHDFLSGMKYKDIANKHGVTLSAVKSWAARDWKRLQPASKKVATKTKKVATKKQDLQSNKRQKTGDEIIVQSLDENAELTDEQKDFCLHFVHTYNATKSYQKAYGCSYNAAAVEGHYALRNPKIFEEITRLKKFKRLQLMANEEDLVEMHLRIAFADMKDYLDFGQEEVSVMGMFGPMKIKDEETGEEKPLMKTVNFVRFHEGAEVDGQLIKEIKVGKDGASVKLVDRQKSLDFLERWFTANPLSKHKIAYDNARLAIENEKLKGGGNEMSQTWFDEIVNTDE